MYLIAWIVPSGMPAKGEFGRFAEDDGLRRA